MRFAMYLEVPVLRAPSSCEGGVSADESRIKLIAGPIIWTIRSSYKDSLVQSDCRLLIPRISESCTDRKSISSHSAGIHVDIFAIFQSPDNALFQSFSVPRGISFRLNGSFGANNRLIIISGDT